MDNKLFLMNGNQAEKMEIQIDGYESEAYLQRIIKDNPNLLTRSSEDGIEKKLFLVEREYAIKDNEDGGPIYSLDHLMVDEDGIPVLVEVKRSTDTRIKREVVAQMIDYAARASKWDIEAIKESFNENNPEEERSDDFWQKVATNLAAEHFRMVFVADEIPDSLRLLIEFLDRSMKDIEVYGVELKPYATEKSLLLASNVVGNSLIDSKKASSSVKKPIIKRSFEKFKEEYVSRGLNDVLSVAEDLYNYALSMGFMCVSGQGIKDPSYNFSYAERLLFRLSIWHNRPLIEFDRKNLSYLLGDEFDKESIRLKLIDLPNKQDDFEILHSYGERYMYINLRLLQDETNRTYLKQMISDFVQKIKNKSEIDMPEQ